MAVLAIGIELYPDLCLMFQAWPRRCSASYFVSPIVLIVKYDLIQLLKYVVAASWPSIGVGMIVNFALAPISCNLLC